MRKERSVKRHVEEISAALHGRKLVGDMDFFVPLVPPSVNHYKKPVRRGKHLGWYVTEEAKAFKDAVALCAKNDAVRYDNYFIEIWLNLGKGDRLDIDNCTKVILDALQEAGIIHSDAFVSDLTVHKRRRWKSPGTNITIWQPNHSIIRQHLGAK